MQIEVELNKDFERFLYKMYEEYGDDFAELNGLSKKYLSFSDFIDNFKKKKTAADAIHILLLTEEDGEGYDGKTRLQFGANVGGGIDHNTYFHRVAPLMICCNSGAILS